ncbi:LytR/AlgR family response regulator transcription factor [Priestia aryabhattai]|uniref:LytR/AlgR family response regulator transcription factor n=1 Tax=Priestia aryabhattai TaxID=412384 RepID=UPI00064FD799|nr:LytTR family DNA-binding domain-containing protein [Priestia aryabhattai]UPK52825.1 LytTR family DNA-binding domain-containing protein [Bacillus sp. H8-1]KML31381.1 hypothetical protein VL11_02155 [Priestia aryabhattai]KMN91412.1 hypothetical protein ABV89_27855 [Priestia aryabhattai]MDC7767134.1 LytTR family DNA-binding domain-containing protein [Priestia aryabhattai]WKG33425.1 LytTR family DNA-binding domain-containing protein [Priestia aryabhattai]
MINLNILAIDDDPIQLQIYKDVFENSPYDLVYVSTNGDSVPLILNEQKIDVALLDIHLSNHSGFDLAEHINQYHKNIKIIFISGDKSLALEAYNFYPLDYIIKPINVFRLFQTLNRIAYKEHDILRIGVKTASGFSLIKKDNIVFISKKSNKTNIYQCNGELFETNEKLDIYETKLLNYGFYRTHKSYLVNLHKVKSIQKDEFMKSYNLLLYDLETTIPVSKYRIKGLKEALDKQFNL